MFQLTTHANVTRLLLGRTLFGRTLYTVNAYKVDDLLVDCGPPATAGAVLAWARTQDIRRVVLTHHHEDHSGGSALLQRALDLPVYAGAASIPLLAHFPAMEFYRRVVWGRPAPIRARALEDTLVTANQRFTVVPTPGHAPDHVALFDAACGWLFSGDLFVHERVRYTGPHEDLWLHIASLRRVLALEPQRLFCAHAGVVTDAQTALRRKIAYWEDLAAQAAALRAQDLPLPEITTRLLGPEGRMAHWSRGHYTKANLVRALLAAHE